MTLTLKMIASHRPNLQWMQLFFSRVKVYIMPVLIKRTLFVNFFYD